MTIKTLTVDELLKDIGAEGLVRYLALKAQSEAGSEGRRKSCFIYIVSSLLGLKVGISHCPSERLKQLQVGNSDTLSLIYTMDLGEEAGRAEKYIHMKLSKHQISGEWFKCHKRIVLKHLQEFQRLINL